MLRSERSSRPWGASASARWSSSTRCGARSACSRSGTCSRRSRSSRSISPFRLPTVMAERVWTLPGNTPGFEAALLMAREGIRYVLVVEAGRLVGVVSESRLFSAWGGGLGDTGAAIRAARDVDGVVAAASGIPALAERLREQGLRPESVTRVITTLDDLVTQQLIEVCGGAPLMQAGGRLLDRARQPGPRRADARHRPGQRDRLRRQRRPGSAQASAAAVRAQGERGARPQRFCALPRRHHGRQPGLVPVGFRVARAVCGVDRPRRSPGAAQRGHLLRLPPGLRQP